MPGKVADHRGVHCTECTSPTAARYALSPVTRLTGRLGLWSGCRGAVNWQTGGMGHRREQIAMTDDEVHAFLSDARTAILCTVGPDGVPDPVPMWFVLRDGEMWLRTYAKSQKVVNLQRDPRVSLLIETGERYAELRGVQLTGRLDVSHDEATICEVFADLMIKYEGMDPAHRAAAIEGYRPKAAQMVAMRLIPERTISWDHRKLAAAHGG